MNLSGLLAVNGRKYATKPALIDGHRSITYAEWNRLADRWACHLCEAGITAGDRVLLMMPNCLEFAVSYFAVMRCGGVIVPINARSTLEDVLYMCQLTDAKGIIAHERLYPELAELPERHLLRVAVKTGDADGGWIGTKDWEKIDLQDKMKALSCEGLEHLANDYDRETSMLFTSGTTGKPKAVVFTQPNLLAVGQMIAVELELTHRSRVLQLMPLSHSASLHLFFVTSVMVGATQVLAPIFTPELMLQLSQDEQITHFFGAPVAFLLTRKHPDFARYDLSSVRFWIYGGAPLSSEMATLLEQSYGREKLVCVYGLTEAGPTGTCLHHREYPHKVGSIGNRATLFTEAEVVDEHGRHVQPNVPGEVRIRGEGMMKGYYNNPQATAETIRGGWIYTGDVARIDEDGFIWIIDRKKDVIISGGVNIYPKEVEQELERHPAIQEVAVVGLPHPEWGETVVAYLVPQAELPHAIIDWTEEIRRFLAGRIADYKLPRLAISIEALPRNASGKILKQQLINRGDEGLLERGKTR